MAQSRFGTNVFSEKCTEQCESDVKLKRGRDPHERLWYDNLAKDGRVAASETFNNLDQSRIDLFRAFVGLHEGNADRGQTSNDHFRRESSSEPDNYNRR